MENAGGRQSYTQALRNNQDNGKRIFVNVVSKDKRIPFAHIECKVEDGEMVRFQKAYIGVSMNFPK